MEYNAEQHTFMICAYKENPYLEDCIQSVMRQSVLGNVFISTATPNDYIMSLAKKYGINVIVNTGKGDTQQDSFNFALSQATTPLVTLAHQDDMFKRGYLENILSVLNTSKHPLIAFTDYNELRGNNEVCTNRLLKIKRLLLFPLRIKAFRKSKFIRRRSLSFGCAICCPAVTYVCPNLTMPIYHPDSLSNLDWQAWEKLSKQDGEFLYCPKRLLLHRIHEGSGTSDAIVGGQRKKDDFEMFCKFWPRPIAKILIKLYSTSEKSNFQ